MHLDALGNEVIVGHRYGYSTSVNGRGSVVIGVAQRLTKQKVTLKIELRREFLYGEEVNRYHGDQETSVTSYHLFPLQPSGG